MTGNGAGTPQGALLSKGACEALRSDGGTCGAPPGPEGLCFWHDPAQRQEMVGAARKGGARKSLDLPVSQPLAAEEGRGVLASVLKALLEGALDAGTARAAAYILQVERKIAEGDALERRIAALEAAMGGQKSLPESVFDVEPSRSEFSVEVES